MTYLALSLYFRAWNCTEYVIRGALRRARFKRYIARFKCKLSAKNKADRLTQAIKHRHWTLAPGRHNKTWVTRMPDEEMEETCMINRVRKKKGWMFQGSFHGATKGPGIFWEKDWGKINQESYCAHTVPVIHGQMRMNPGLVLM